MSDPYRVWAIEYEGDDRVTRTVAVSAESEYGAVKRLVGNRHAMILRVEAIAGRAPEFRQRRIEGCIAHDFAPGTDRWEYT